MTDHITPAAAPRSAPLQASAPIQDDAAKAESPAVPEPDEPPARRSVWKLVLAVIVLAALSGLFLFFPIDWDKVGRWGYVGVFLVVFIATASVALPIPYLFVVARAAFFLDPLGVTLVAGLAGALGELSGYVRVAAT
jgi:hypothetical protein